MAHNDNPPDALMLAVQDSPKPERADAARNRKILLEAASRILRDKGISALSMESVAAAAGVGIGTVYRRFGDRSGLAYALVDETEREFQAAFISGPPPLGPGAPPGDRLRAYLHRHVDRLAEQAELLAMAENGTNRFRLGAYYVQRRHVSMLINEINPDLDNHYLADTLIAPLTGRLFLHQTVDQGMSIERIKAGLDQLLDGITS